MDVQDCVDWWMFFMKAKKDPQNLLKVGKLANTFAYYGFPCSRLCDEIFTYSLSDDLEKKTYISNA